ncbi:TM2 domain-containing protein [Paraferrimonas haliotis]|uniref:TM2 domain-containing protein n=1 Tax=Paraferrimonas haliotis TaxID=2013866 RepID=UPI000BA978AD|nr:TM2 domain-containing protein [Paraferrimonas haliotis]
MLTLEECQREKDELQRQLNQLTDETRARIYAKLKKQLKDPDTYAVLNYLFIAGMHHFYLGKINRGFINLCCFLLGAVWLVMGSVWGLLPLLIITLIELKALFQSQRIVANYNLNVMKRLMGLS